MRTPFEHAEQATRVFYSKVFFNVIFNINAVQMGLYHRLLCDMEEPAEALHWKTSMLVVFERLKQLRRET